jgi:hypothetical protein
MSELIRTKIFWTKVIRTKVIRTKVFRAKFAASFEDDMKDRIVRKLKGE